MHLTGQAQVAHTLGALTAAIDPTFEAEHPRGGDGKFITKGGWVKFILNGIWQVGQVEGTMAGMVSIKHHNKATGKDESALIPRQRVFRATKPDKIKARLDPSGWTNVGGQKGSNTGGTFKDDKGREWYVKTPQSKSHAANEYVMNLLYAEAGAAAPKVALSPDGTKFMSRIEPGAGWGTLSGQAREDAKDAAAKDFVIDAWLANWDAPINNSNIRITPEGQALRIDSGGAGMYRARGGVKKLDPRVSELQSLRDPQYNAPGQELYSKVTREHEIDATKRILAISPDRIRELVKDNNLPAKLATDLIARRAWLANHYGLDLPETTPEGIKQIHGIPKSQQVVDVTPKLAAPEAASLVVGAPVWFKNKAVGDADGTPRSVMLIKAVNEDGTYDLETYDVKSTVTVKNVPTTAFFALRENKAIAGSVYISGEDPQIGDEVSNPAWDGTGTVQGFWGNSALIKMDDGRGKQAKITSLKREKAGSGVALTTPRAIAANLGEQADVNNPKERFPVMAFSPRFNAEVFVLDYDPSTDKAKIATHDGRSATVAATTLLKPKTVDRAAAAALAARKKTPATPREPKAPIPLDQLPAKWVNLNKHVSPVEIEPGDRIFKVKERGKSRIHWLKIHKNGDLEYLGNNGGNGGNFLWDANRPASSVVSMLNASDWRSWRHSGADYTDATPGRYNEAANELGPENINPPVQTETLVWKGIDKPAYDAAYQAYIHWDSTSGTPRPLYPDRTSYIKKFSTKIAPEPGDYYRAAIVSGARSLGTRVGWGNDEPIRVARIFMERGGKFYDIGRGGELYDKPNRWVEISQADWYTIGQLKTPEYASKVVGEEDSYKAVLSDGTRIEHGVDDEMDQVHVLNNTANLRSAFTGGATKPIGTRINWTGAGETLLEALSRRVTDWKRDPNKTPSGLPRTPAGPAQDVSKLSGVKALGHTLSTSREEILKGNNDARLLEIVDATYEEVTPTSGYGTVYKISDGSLQGDPLMAEFSKDLDGNQQTLVAPTRLFNQFKKMVDEPATIRGVQTQDQRDAILHGEHWNGRGVYGNGVYSNPSRAETNSYGGFKVRMLPKPGSKGIQNDELFVQQAEDVGESVRQRQELLAEAGIGFPTVAEIEAFDAEAAPEWDDLKAAAGFSVPDAKPLHVKAAILHYRALKNAGLNPEIKITNGYSYGYQPGINIDVPIGLDGVAPDPSMAPGAKLQPAEILRLSFNGPWKHTRTSYGRATKVDETKNFSMVGDLLDPTSMTSKLGTKLSQAYDNSSYRDNTVNALLASGVLDKLGKQWDPDRVKKAGQIDGRISFLSDVGRFALAAGYDWFFIPGERHYIYTHRAAFILDEDYT